MEPDETKKTEQMVEKAVEALTVATGQLSKYDELIAESARKNAGEADTKLAAKAAEIQASVDQIKEDLKGLISEGSTAQAQELKAAIKRIEELELSPQRPANGRVADPNRKTMGQLFTAATIEKPEFKSFDAGQREGRQKAISWDHIPFKTQDWLDAKALSTVDVLLPTIRQPQTVDMVAPPSLIMRNLIRTRQAPANATTIDYLRYQGASSGTPKSVTTITRDGSVATVTVTAHGFRKWDRVLIAGAAQAEYNGYRHIFEIIDANSFKVKVVGTPASGSGTMTVVRVNQHGAPDVVTEGSDKPVAAMRWSKETASLVVIAHSIEVTRQTLWHMAGIQQKIDEELMTGLDVNINYRSLWDAGGSDLLQGLMTLPATDTQTYAWSEGKNGDTKIDAIRRARTRLEVLNRFPTGVIIGPEDNEDLDLAKGDDLHYIRMDIPQAGGLPPLMWRMPVLVTPAMDTGSFLEADFPAAATYYLGQDAQMYMTDSHDKNFLKNIINILVEIELQLVVENPSAIVVGTFDSAPTAP